MLIHMLSQRLPPESLTGAPLQALQLSRALLDCDARVHLFTTQRRGAPPPRTGDSRLAVTSLQYPGLTQLLAPLRAGCGALAARTISRADVVHAHALSPMVLGYALMRRKGDPPLLVKPSLGGEHEEGEIRRVREALPTHIRRRALSSISAFAVLDDLIAQELATIGVSESRMIRVNNGIDLSRFQPATASEKSALRQRFGLQHARHVVLVCGQLCRRKGTDLLLDAWPLQLAACRSVTLAFAGAGPLQPLVAAAAGRHPGQIVHLGQLDDSAPATRMCDAAVLVSHCESFGNVVVEALASGLPVAATPCGIAARLIRSGDTGWPIPSLHAGGLNETLRCFLEAADSWSGYAGRCRATASEFDFRQIAAEYVAIYRRLRPAR